MSLFENPMYQETAFIIVTFLLVLSIGFFFLRNKGTLWAVAWASIKSWWFAGPVVLIALALPGPWPLIFLTFVSIMSSKVFFQMTGMYHRTYFVWVTYIFIIGLGYIIYKDIQGLYNMMPMIFMGALACIPLIRNSATDMIQYMALSLMAFIFFGWSFMHLGRLLEFDKGPFVVLYLYLLTEVSENAALASYRLGGRWKLFRNITQKVTVEGFFASIVVSLLLAWGMRHLLPDRSEKFWIAAGLVAALFGRFGRLFLAVVRRDLGIKNTGVFIIGRGDILNRVDKLLFVAPLYYYLYFALQRSEAVDAFLEKVLK